MRLPQLTSKKIVQVLKRAGFVKDRQKGSHLVMIHPKTGARTVVPMHFGKTLKRSLVYAMMGDAGLSQEEFSKLL